MQSSLRFLAIGDSLTAGFCNYGLSNHPYAINLFKLFSLSNISIIIDQKGVSGEYVVPSMVKRLENLVFNEHSPHYNWIILLGGTRARTSTSIASKSILLLLEKERIFGLN
ncbi:unnamed protein product [Rotaria socialis]